MPPRVGRDAAGRRAAPAAAPKTAGSKAAGSKAAGSKAAGSKAAESKAAESKAAESKAAESRAVAPPLEDGQALDQALEALGLPLDERARRQLLDYCALLRKWNAVYNLTAVRDPQAMLVQHLFDCLAIIPALRAGPDRLADGAVVLDVGSGGGLPGVVLAIVRPSVQVHCVDTVGKKAAFITQVRAELGLANLHAHHARVEALQAPRDLPPASLIVSRAFSSLSQFVSLTTHLRAGDGVWAAMKGQWPAEEIAELPAGLQLSATFTLTVPQLDARRHLLLVEPAG